MAPRIYVKKKTKVSIICIWVNLVAGTPRAAWGNPLAKPYCGHWQTPVRLSSKHGVDDARSWPNLLIEKPIVPALPPSPLLPLPLGYKRYSGLCVQKGGVDGCFSPQEKENHRWGRSIT